MEQEFGDLDDDTRAKRDELLSEGFGDWTKRNLSAFIRWVEPSTSMTACRANAMYSRYDIDSIAAYLKDKSYEEVKRYSQIFWERYTSIPKWEKYIKRIEQGEDVLLKRHHLHQVRGICVELLGDSGGTDETEGFVRPVGRHGCGILYAPGKVSIH